MLHQLLQQIHRDDHPKRLRDLEYFVAIAARYADLESLLTVMAFDPPTDSVNDVLASDEEEGLLTLSTISLRQGPRVAQRVSPVGGRRNTPLGAEPS